MGSSDKNISDEGWDLVIQAKSGFLDFNLRELLHYRDLIGLLVRRDLASVYKQTLLGYLWFVIQPLLTTVMYMFVFGGIAKIGTDGIPQPLFYFCGSTLWTYFSLSLVKSADTFVANSTLFGKIYFPRFIVPIAYTLTNIIGMAVQFVALLIFYVYYLATGFSFTPTLWLLAIPLIILSLGMLGTGIGITISSITAKYRDLKQLIGFGMTLWMYATPVVYPLSEVPKGWRLLVTVNPVSSLMETFRYAFLGKGSHSVKLLVISLIVTVLFFAIGIVVFKRSERTFIDII